MDLRERLRTVLKEKGLSPRAAALKAGLADTTIYKFLSGHSRTLTVENLEKIADALGVSLRFLMFGEPEMENLHYIWDHIKKRDRERALAILKTFADDTDTENTA